MPFGLAMSPSHSVEVMHMTSSGWNQEKWYNIWDSWKGSVCPCEGEISSCSQRSQEETLFQHRLSCLRPKEGKWPPNIHFILYANNVHGCGSDLWWAAWRSWRNIHHCLDFQQPTTADDTARQHIFWNAELLDPQDNLFGNNSYSFGSSWMNKKVYQLKDLWSMDRWEWKTATELAAIAGPNKTAQRRSEILDSLPRHWSMSQSPTFGSFEWVAATPIPGTFDRIYQLHNPHEGRLFSRQHYNLFTPQGEDLINISEETLQRVRIVTTCGGLRTVATNPGTEYAGPVWSLGLTRTWDFDLKEWTWVQLDCLPAALLYNYSTRRGYRIALQEKPQLTRMHRKLNQLGLDDDERKLALWDFNKPAKLQTSLCNRELAHSHGFLKSVSVLRCANAGNAGTLPPQMQICLESLAQLRRDMDSTWIIPLTPMERDDLRSTTRN